MAIGLLIPYQHSDAPLLQNNSLHFEDTWTYGMHQQIKGDTPPALDGDKIKHHMNTLTLLLSLLDINLRWNNHSSLHDWAYLKKILHHRGYWLLAIYHGILHMECSSHSTTFWIKDLDPQTFSSAIERVYTAPFLQWLYPAPVIHWRRNIIWSLSDHIEWCFQMGAYPRRYQIWKWEWKFKCSHSSMLRTMTISCFNPRKFIFQTHHSQIMPISWLPPHSALPTDLPRKMMNPH